MFHTRKLNNHINSILERALRLVHRDNKATLEEILHKNNSVTVHHKKHQLLATIQSIQSKNQSSSWYHEIKSSIQNPTYKPGSDATRKIRITNHHSHKKQKNSLETWVKRIFLYAYVESKAILEPILLYRASKCKEIKRPCY